MRGSVALGFALLVGLGGCKDDAPEDSQPVELGPTLTHTVPTDIFYVGDELSLTVNAVDTDGVSSVSVYFRTSGQPYWSSGALTASGDDWSITLPTEELGAPGVEYYFKATDGAGSVSYLPTDLLAEDPFAVPILVRGLELPFFEDFEVEAGQNDIYDLGWAASADGFAGFLWNLTTARAYSGSVSVEHSRGSTEAGELDDWLISPALDFSALDQVQVSWFEYGANTDGAQHRLFISAGSRVPDDGDYVEVSAPPAPASGEWSRARAVNLSEWGGESTVYLAWRYTGANADDWMIDDVSVRALTLDLESEFSASPLPVHPGDDVELVLSLNNLADIAADDLSVTLTLPSGAGVLDADTVSAGAIAGLGSAEADFQLTVDAAWPDNSYMPLHFDVSDGTDTWSFDHTLTVGTRSTARLELDLDESGVVQVTLGQGDPSNPSWEDSFWSVNASAGPLSLEADVTDYYASLPPAAGAERWFARVDSSAAGQIQSFELEYNGETYASSTPLTLDLADATLVYVPEPADPVLVSASSTPSTLSPGSAGVTLSLVLRNDGADASGPVNIRLVSADPDVTINDAGPIEIASFTAGSGAVLPQAFSLDVSADHVDSTSVDLTLELSDDFDTWELPVELAVPWPVIQITGVDIDDRSGGDNDGLLEPGEDATLTLEVSNVGGLGAFGIVSGHLELLSSSTAIATVSPDSQTFGQLSPGTSRDDDFDVSVDAASALGDTLDLVLRLSDGTTTYDAPVQIVLGERPWIQVSVSGDSTGDNNGYTFDLANVRYRCDGTTFEIEFASHTAFDAGTAFVEMWAVPTSAGYSYFRLVLQSGTARLQGYSGGFQALTNPTVSFPDATHARLSWPVSVMNMNTNSFRAGFGAGWCGVDTGSYCDHFPDNWGYYYTGYSSTNFFSFRW